MTKQSAITTLENMAIDLTGALAGESNEKIAKLLKKRITAIDKAIKSLRICVFLVEELSDDY